MLDEVVGGRADGAAVGMPHRPGEDGGLGSCKQGSAEDSMTKEI